MRTNDALLILAIWWLILIGVSSGCTRAVYRTEALDDSTKYVQILQGDRELAFMDATCTVYAGSDLGRDLTCILPTPCQGIFQRHQNRLAHARRLIESTTGKHPAILCTEIEAITGGEM